MIANKFRFTRRALPIFAGAVLFSAGVLAQTPQPGGAGSAQQQPGMSNSPGSSGAPGSGAPGMNGMNSTDADSSQQSFSDKAFVSKALQGGNEEVQLGQMAQQKAQGEDVKQFAQKMVQDHTQLGDEMKPIAKQLDVQQPKGPSKKDKETMAKLQGLSGQQFDDAYIKTMVKDHKQDLKEFKDESAMTQNPALKQATQQGQNVISQHLQMIEQIAQNHNIPIDGK